jgi:hypothetical protein
MTNSEIIQLKNNPKIYSPDFFLLKGNYKWLLKNRIIFLPGTKIIIMNWEDEDDFDFNDDMSDEEQNEFEREYEEEKKRRKNHPLVIQGEEIYNTVSAIVECIPDEDREVYASTLMESAMIIPAKIAGAVGCDSWLLSMQNAAIIRYHAEYLLTSTSGLKIFTKTDKDYIKILREEMTRFREIFSEWVQEIHKIPDDEYPDEWGLFIRNPS